MQNTGRKRALAVLSGCLVMVVTACAGGGHGGNPEPLVGSRWLAQTIGGRPAALYPASTVRFDVGQRITGDGGCNTFNGTIGYAGNQMAVGQLATTRKMCPPEVMTQETAFLQALQTAKRFEMTDWLLTLYGASGDAQMTLTRMTGPT